MLEGFDIQSFIDGILAQIVELLTGLFNDIFGSLLG